MVLNFVPMMKATIKYLAGIPGPSGYGSKTAAKQVAEDCLRSMRRPTPHLTVTAIVTGATSGLGAETARVLAKNGVRVIIPALYRELSKAEKVKENIQKENQESEIIISEMDLCSFASIQRFCSDFLSLGLPLHILINNAGIMSNKLEFSEDNIEQTFATNYLGHFLLTEMLLGKIMETASESGKEGRIVNVSSVAHNWASAKNFCFDKLLNPESYNQGRAYAQSKLATILHAKELARQFKGAATTCYVALSPMTTGLSGKYFADCNETNCSPLANDETEARKLWNQTWAFIQSRLHQPLDQNVTNLSQSAGSRLLNNTAIFIILSYPILAGVCQL
ncbi:hypothetical protein RD792_004797 [Penstemon davidsonii]|uniref:Uncharacterized protein n=1 Tax=Penstemon davidsonii TaxID=160366 RepID=A0ABR0DIC0_9LAMI|nr:hypothetical protein RD792_004797 [Penstemon davidsonii]